MEMLSGLIGHDAMETMYEEQLHKDPNDLDTRYTYGRFLWKVRGDFEAAEGAMLKVLAADPADEEAQDALAQVRTLSSSASKT